MEYENWRAPFDIRGTTLGLLWVALSVTFHFRITTPDSVCCVWAVFSEVPGGTSRVLAMSADHQQVLSAHDTVSAAEIARPVT